MNTNKLALFAATAVAAITLSNPASAALFTYSTTSGTLTIDNVSGIGTLKDAAVNATFTSPDFLGFQGGTQPATTTNLTFVLTALTGTRIINGVSYTPNPQHQQVLKLYTTNAINLWSNWGNPAVGGDYVTYITGYTPPKPGTPVPAPGILGLFGLGMVGLAFGRRRKAAKINSVSGNISFA